MSGASMANAWPLDTGVLPKPLPEMTCIKKVQGNRQTA
ncbi:hypothetical protein C4K38_3393 [Pseudomonas chlororaphis subsp. piscium]|nr:hypothetical protein C4K38_3393 [Pseudomonas chlororaphis subsp. piscium]